VRAIALAVAVALAWATAAGAQDVAPDPPAEELPPPAVDPADPGPVDPADPGLVDPAPEDPPVPTTVPPRPAWGELEEEYHGAVEAELAMRAELDQAVAEAARRAEVVAGAAERVRVAAGQLIWAEAGLARTTDDLTVVEADLVDTERQLATERRRLEAQIVQAYIGGGAAPMANVQGAFEGDTAAVGDLAKSRVYAEAVVVDRKKVVERVAALVVHKSRLQDRADEARQQATERRDEVADRVAELEAERAEQAEAQADADAAAARAAELAAELEVTRQGYERRYAELAAQSDSIASLLQARQRDQEPATSTSGTFLNPTVGGKVGSDYGLRLHPILNEWKQHTGLDIGAAQGEALRASAAGQVVLVGEQGGYGLTVVIDHGGQLATLYGHLSAIDVVVGQEVLEGERIGAAGSTGLSTGPHCHWEVRVDGFPVDGRPYLRSP
jgi:murein DD-endopeptidase MepM/ murein hydrolase activator NlpD